METKNIPIEQSRFKSELLSTGQTPETQTVRLQEENGQVTEREVYRVGVRGAPQSISSEGYDLMRRQRKEKQKQAARAKTAR